MNLSGPELITSGEKNLVGMRRRMSFADYRVAELWRAFMPRRIEIQGSFNPELFSLAFYPRHYFNMFNPANEFERWACIEVAGFNAVPPEMERLVLSGSLYAVFHYKGMSNSPAVFNYIYNTWLPASGYVLDERPHFEVLGAGYKNNDPGSEEAIWIPVTK